MRLMLKKKSRHHEGSEAEINFSLQYSAFVLLDFLLMDLQSLEHLLTNEDIAVHIAGCTSALLGLCQQSTERKKKSLTK